MYTRSIVALLIFSSCCIWPSAWAEPVVDDDFNPLGYYTFRQDLRRCVSPRCGGLFVKAVNQKLTRCADGVKRTECYVALLANPHGLAIGSASLLQGRIRPKRFSGFGNLGVFKLRAAISSATASTGEGTVVGLQDNGIVCITAPCFSYDEFVLNRNKILLLSGIDLEASGAAEQDIDNARRLLADGETLLAAGVNKRMAARAGAGTAFFANQLYFPIEPESP